MHKDKAVLWTAALRSGEFEQGVRMLETADGRNCCLGVLCALAAESGVTIRTVNPDGTVFYGNKRGILPDEVVIWAGMHSGDGYYFNQRREEECSLVGHNDVDSYTFEQIADVIDARVSEL
jgi:hypothetical protein